MKYWEPDWYCQEQKKAKALQKYELMSGRPVIQKNTETKAMWFTKAQEVTW